MGATAGTRRKWPLAENINTAIIEEKGQAMAKTPIYRGFSSISGSSSTASRTEVYDVSLVKQDILNHFNVRYREIPGRPGFGCAIYNLLADPFDDITEASIREEVERVVGYDPRVEISGFDALVNKDGAEMQVFVSLLYKELGLEEVVTFSVAMPR